MKKKILSFLMVFAFVIPCMFSFAACKDSEKEPETTPEISQMEKWDGTTATVSAAVDNVILIETAEELAGLAKNVNDGTTTYAGITVKLTCDMDFDNKNWTPIGYGRARSNNGERCTGGTGKAFEGIFDGQNHTIKNLKIVGVNNDEIIDDNDDSSCGVGLFGLVFGSIKNLTIDTADVTGNHYVGAIVGYISNFSENNTYVGSIENCHVKNAEVHCVYGTEDNSGDKAGALVGYLDQTSIENCSVKDCEVDANRDAGQMIGGVAHTTNMELVEGNTATNVEVSCNDSNTSVDNHGNNIKNELIGRV